MVSPGRALATASTVLAAVGAVTAGAIALHTAINLRHLRTPDPQAPEVADPVTVLIPARNEERHVESTVRSVLAQTGVPHLTVAVLDDGSTDGTPGIIDRLADEDPRVRALHGSDDPLPPGWLGKPWACQRLAEQSDSDPAGIVVFVDADVILEPEALRACIHELRNGGFALVAPYPRQTAGSMLERLVQPLVTWSWVATIPLGWAESSLRPSLSAANGQLLVLDESAYRAIGGHAAVRDSVIEDVWMMRALKRGGHRCATVDGSHLATCRMYDGPDALVDGYAKSLWAAFNGPAGSVAVNAVLVGAYVVPPLAALTARSGRTRALGLMGYAAGVASRALVARRTGESVGDAALQPASIAAFATLNAISWMRHLRGTNTWKGRAVVARSA